VENNVKINLERGHYKNVVVFFTAILQSLMAEDINMAMTS